MSATSLFDPDTVAGDTAAAIAVDAAETQLYVCTTCRLLPEPAEPRAARAGARLHARLERAGNGLPNLRIVPVECLSVCRRACTVAFAAAGKWTYVVGDFHPELAATEILAAAAQFGAAPDGLIPWRERSEALKRNVVARIPPLVPLPPPPLPVLPPPAEPWA